MKLKDILNEGKEAIQDSHYGHIKAMLKKGLENEARWALAGGVKAKQLEQAYRFVERIDQSIFGRKGGSKETGPMRQVLDRRLWHALGVKYDSDSMAKINTLFNNLSKGY